MHSATVSDCRSTIVKWTTECGTTRCHDHIPKFVAIQPSGKHALGPTATTIKILGWSIIVATSVRQRSSCDRFGTTIAIASTTIAGNRCSDYGHTWHPDLGTTASSPTTISTYGDRCTTTTRGTPTWYSYRRWWFYRYGCGVRRKAGIYWPSTTHANTTRSESMVRNMSCRLGRHYGYQPRGFYCRYFGMWARTPSIMFGSMGSITV